MRIRPDRWLLALPIVAALWAGATIVLEPRLADRLLADATAIADATAENGRSEPWLSVAVDGRDLVATGEAPTQDVREAVLDRLAHVRDARRVRDLTGVVASPPHFTFVAVWDGSRIRAEGFRPAEIGREAFQERLRAGLPDEIRFEDATRAGAGAPELFVDLAVIAVRELASLSAGSATVTDATVSLKGAAADPESYNGARAALRRLPAGASIGAVEIEPPIARPFLWSAERRSDGALVLGGHVPNERLRGEVVAVAERIAPGLVLDRMQTATGTPPAVDYLTAVRFALAELGHMQEGTVSTTDDRLSLRGAAIKGAIADLAAAVQTRLPHGLSPGPVELRPARVEPYLFSARRTSDSVVLEGYYPDERTRDAVLNLLKPRFFGEAILDRARLADGAPPRFLAAVEAAVAQLSYLASGEASLRGTALTLKGESLYPETAERMRQTLAAAAPPGWTVEADVSARGGDKAASAKP